MRRRSSTRFGLFAAVAVMAALVVTPGGTTASFTIVPGGPTVQVTVSNSGGTSNATFSGTAGQRVSLNFTNVTITSSKVSFLKPDGSNLVTPFTVTRTGFWLDVKTLPATGTYKILVDPKLDYTGRMNLTLYDVPANPTAALATDGTPTTMTTTTPGQNATLTFSGTAGNRLSVELSDVGWNSARMRILNPDSTALFSTAFNFGPGGGFLEPKTLPATGTYTVVLDPKLLATGSATVRAYIVPPDTTAAITPGGSAVTVTTTAPGQNGSLTFSGTANQRVSVNLTNVTYERAKVSILKPDGSVLFTPSVLATSEGAFVEPKKLPATGTYTIKVNPEMTNTGALDAALFVVPADASGTIAANGTPATISTTVPGQNAALTFSGTSGKRISLKLTGVTMADAGSTGLSLKILRPDGTTLDSDTLGTDGKFLDTQSLNQTGTYKILLDPRQAVTGSATLTLYTVPADATASIAANGTPTTIATTTPGQSAVLTFNGAANQRVAFTVSKGAVSSLKASLAKVGATSNIISPTSVSVDPHFFDTKPLGASAGTFKITLDPGDDYTGSMTVTLYNVPPDVTGNVANGSNSVTLAIGQNARLTFPATAGQKPTFTFSSGTIPGFWVRILGLNGTTPIESAFWDPSISNSPVTDTLAQAGTYTFLVDPDGTKSGSVTFTFAPS